MTYTKEQIQEIKNNVSITSLAKHLGIKLTKKGRGYIALCPFHDDKTPSFLVDEKKGLFKCFGGNCPANKGGDHITLVQMKKGLSFQEAVKYLAEFAGLHLTHTADTGSGKVPLKSYATKSRSDFTEKQKRDAMTRAVEIWQNNLSQSKTAQQALKEERGINSNKVIIDFHIGFSTGNLEKMVKTESEQEELLKEIGVLNEQGKEVFKGFLVFPFLADERVVSLYGRNVRMNAKFRHIYSAGQHQGVYNEKALKVYDEIILCECVIDALTLYTNGFKNVTCTYGLNGLTEEIQKSIQSNVKKLYFAFDNEQPAERKAREYAKLFPNITSKLIKLPEDTKDINEYFVNAGYGVDQFKELILNSRILHTAEGHKFDVEETVESGQVNYLFNLEQFTIKLSGIPKKYTPPLKCTVKMTYLPENKVHYDNIDLFSAQRRSSFSNQVGRIFGIDHEAIEQNLLDIIEHLEKRNSERTDKPKDNREQEEPMTEEEQKIGLRFLKSPNLIKEIMKDIETVGYVGEKNNCLLVYLAGVSRKMDDPLCVIILSRSSAGKSHLVGVVEKLTPLEDVLCATTISDQALFYMKNLSNKLITLGEHQGFENIEYLLRELISKKEITKVVTIKNEDGDMEAKSIRVKGPIAMLDTSAHPDLNEENLNRAIILHLNESPKQTKKILDAQKKGLTKEGFIKKQKIKGIMRKHHYAHRLLRNIAVHNPFAPFIDFPNTKITVRRDHLKFQNFILVITFIHQYQRVVKTMYINGREIPYIESTIDDYAIVYELFMNGILKNSLSNIPKMARDMHQIIIEMRYDIAHQERKKPQDILFTRKQIVEYSGLTMPQVRNYCRILEDFEILEYVTGAKGRSGKLYRLIAEKIEDVNLSMIPTPEELQKKINEEQNKRNSQ